MSKNELFTIDTIETADYIRGDLDDDVDLDIPLHMMPPNPDDSESTHISVLPSQVHPSYPYGNPTSAKHPINQPRTLAFDPSSRALFEDMGFAGGGINGAFRWNELALDQLLPIDEEKEEAKRAAQARKMASGAGGGGQQQGQQPPQHQQPGGPPQDLTLGDDDDDDEDEDEEDEDEDDEDEDEEDEDEEDEEGVNSDEEE
ncbi:hypothetical protein BKA70DRAFT_1043425, partial [Coprinopsis sp. MPI-PUGE-AT-0042]